MSVYSYVELKVHTNVRKVGTHLNVLHIERMFAESTPLCLYKCSIYNEHIFVPPLFHFSFPYLYYTISIYKKGTLFPAPYLSCHFLSAPLFTFIYLYYIYSIYREEYTFPQLFTPFPIVLLYSLYIEEGILSPPFFTPL